MAEARIHNTRIALRIDKEQNWTTKNPILLEGEIAMSYGDAQWDSERKTYIYKTFKFKVGAHDKISGRLLGWNELQEINIGSLDPETEQRIVDAVLEKIKGNYVTTESFNEFKRKLDEKVVTGWEVKEGTEELSLIRDLNSSKNKGLFSSLKNFFVNSSNS